MSPGATFERVYRELKRRLGENAWPPGTPIEPALVGPELGASITPVRDALHRLVGERLVEAPGHNGFRVPRPGEAALRDLYAWNGRVLALAVSRMRFEAGGAGGKPPEPVDVATATAGLFLRITRAAGSDEHVRVVAQLNDRLASCRQVEPRALDEVAGEQQALHLLLDAGERTELNRALTRYHRRRIAAVPRILALLSANESSPG